MSFLESSLTSCIYDLALGRDRWGSIIELIAAGFPNCLILVSADDLKSRCNLGFVQRGLGPAAAGEYARVHAAQDPSRLARGRFEPLQVYHDDPPIGGSEFAPNRSYREWLSRQGDFDAATGVVLLRHGTRQLSIEIRYGANATATRDRAATALANAAPHFGRALEIVAHSRLATGTGYLDHLVEHLPFGVFFVNGQLDIRYCNRSGETLLRSGIGPFSSGEGPLRAIDRAADADLRATVARLAGSRRAPCDMVRLRVPGREADYFAVCRAQNRHRQGVQLHDAVLDEGPLVMLVLRGSTESTPPSLKLLWPILGLTEAEARLAEALVQGETVADYAKERQVATQTVRKQVMMLLRKTGTRRQSELVALLTRFASACI